MRIRRSRVTLSLPSDLVELIDRCSAEIKETRSGLVEEWLRYASLRHRKQALDDEITAYYTNRSAAQRREDDAIARWSTRMAALIDYDQPKQRRKR